MYKKKETQQQTQNIAQNVHQLRIAAGLSQEALAEQLHITRSAIAHYERGTRIPDIETVIQIAELFHVNLERVIL